MLNPTTQYHVKVIWSSPTFQEAERWVPAIDCLEGLSIAAQHIWSTRKGRAARGFVFIAKWHQLHKHPHDVSETTWAPYCMIMNATFAGLKVTSATPLILNKQYENMICSTIVLYCTPLLVPCLHRDEVSSFFTLSLGGNIHYFYNPLGETFSCAENCTYRWPSLRLFH